jgi:hypothetical protein
MIDKELLSILAYSLSPLFYGLGGWKCKFLRREILPITLGTLLFLAGYPLWKCLVYMPLQDGVFRLPYGDKTPYWLKALIGITYSLPSLLFGFTVWQAVLPAVFIVYFILSNWKVTAQEFSWKICEGTVGFQLGIIVARLILKG